jgi:hypothetical protein
MRRTTLILTLILVGCATDDLLVEEEWNGPDDGDVSTAAPTHNPENCPGGGGGGEPSPIPAPRDCTREPTWEQCYACCDWNSKHVWEPTCRRLKRREDRAACWRRLESELRPQCQKSCNRPGGPITTGAP